MVHHAAEITLTPPATPDARGYLDALATACRTGEMQDAAQALASAPPAISTDLLTAVQLIAEALSAGHSATLSRHEATVTTQEAADVLGISRPTLVRLLDQGAIPFSQPSRHRRMLLADVLSYQANHDTTHPHGPFEDEPQSTS